MALLRFDSKNLNLDILVGINETYRPTKKILNIHEKIKGLKEKLESYLEQNIGSKEPVEVLNIFQQDKSKEENWKDFLSHEYSPELNEIIKEIQVINNSLQEKSKVRR